MSINISLKKEDFKISSTDIDTTSTDISPNISTEKNISNQTSSIGETIDENKKLTKQEAQELRETEKIWRDSFSFIKDHISPSMIKIDSQKLQIGDTIVRTIFTYA